MKHIIIFVTLIAVTGSCLSQRMVDEIVLINTGPYDKGQLAKQIEITNALDPKLVALDVELGEYTGSQEDKSLFRAIMNSKKIVLPSKIYNEGKDVHDKDMITVALTCGMQFFPMHARTGFVTAISEVDENQIPKQFSVWQEGYTGDVYHHFSIITAMEFDSLKTTTFIQRHSRLVDVDYNGRSFSTFSEKDVIEGKITKNDIQGKVVLIGFLGPGDKDKYATRNSDKRYMYGVEYLANIVAQVLEQ